jgi:Domain of unknown function (DUF4126)
VITESSGGYATAMALSNAVGLRPFLTLALAAAALHFGIFHPAAQFAWLGSDKICMILGALAVLEFIADKIPAVDHALHAVHFASKPIAAVLVAGAALPAGDPSGGTYVTMALCVLNALGLHGLAVSTRAASTTFSLGAANPIVSLLEDVATVALVAVAAFLPIAGAIVAILALIAAAIALPRIIGWWRNRSAAASYQDTLSLGP